MRMRLVGGPIFAQVPAISILFPLGPFCDYNIALLAWSFPFSKTLIYIVEVLYYNNFEKYLIIFNAL